MNRGNFSSHQGKRKRPLRGCRPIPPLATGWFVHVHWTSAEEGRPTLLVPNNPSWQFWAKSSLNHRQSWLVPDKPIIICLKVQPHSQSQELLRRQTGSKHTSIYRGQDTGLLGRWGITRSNVQTAVKSKVEPLRRASISGKHRRVWVLPSTLLLKEPRPTFVP